MSIEIIYQWSACQNSNTTTYEKKLPAKKPCKKTTPPQLVPIEVKT